MPMKCCFPTCKIQKDDREAYNISFHRLPALESLKEEWVKKLQQHFHFTPKKYTYLCSQHFEKDCFLYSGLCRKRNLKPGTVPTIFFDAPIINPEQHCDEASTSSYCENAFTQYNSADKQDLNEDASLANDTMDDNVSHHDQVRVQLEERIEEEKDKNVALRLRNKILQQRLARARKRINQFESVLDTIKRKIVHYDTRTIKLFLTSVRLRHEPKASVAITRDQKKFFRRVSYEILDYKV